MNMEGIFMSEPDLLSEPDLPKILWHYTDAQGLLGILQSQQFWASSATYLNDDQELDYGYSCLSKSLNIVASELDHLGQITSSGQTKKEEPASLLGDALRFQEAELKGYLKIPFGRPVYETSDIYIVSFCEEGDLLSQWLGYSEGSGYALGFDREELAKSIAQNGLGMRLGKVLYGDDGADMFHTVIKSQIHTPGSNFKIDDMKSLLQEVGWCKHPAFKAEQEWRLKIDTPRKVEVRNRGNDLLPYVKVDFPFAALKEVRIGPGGSRNLREEALKLALEAEGLEVFDCDLSEFENDELSIRSMYGVTDSDGIEIISSENIELELAAIQREKKEAIAEAEAKSDVKISRSKAPYRP